MRKLIAFTKKEYMEQLRNGRLVVLCILFVLLGIMNPAIAKLTPWMYQIFADSLAENGIVVTAVPVNAMTSWTQFFKNIPIGLLLFFLLQSNVFTKEYQSGSLILTITKGFERYKIVVVKTFVLLFLWTVYYWVCYIITYGYNEFYWDNGVAHHLLFAAICWWLFGMWTMLLCVLFSTIVKTNTGVIVGTAVVLFFSYLLGLLPNVKTYSPSMLLSSDSLLSGMDKISLYTPSIVITAVLCVAFFVGSILMMNRKQL